MKNLFLFHITILLFLMGSIPVITQSVQEDENQQEVIARGMGAIIARDLAKAEDDAIANALRNAVEQVIGTMVESEVLVRNYQTLEDRIYSYSKGYVQNYEVINKSQMGESLLEVTVRAVVKKGNLQNNLEALGLLMSRKGKPRLMVIVDEQNMENQGFYTWSIDMNISENELMSVLMEKGFPFVDRQTVMRKIEKDMVIAALEGDEVAAQYIGNQTGAELLLVGKAVAKAASGGPAVLSQAGMVSCQAVLSLRAVRADDGTVLATTSQQAAAAHIDRQTGGMQALQKASRTAAEEITQKIVNRWQKDIYGGTTINLRLMNVETFSDLIKVKNMFPNYIRGVMNVYQRDYSKQTAMFELEVKGNANSVAEEMVLKDFSPYFIEVLNVTQNTIVAKLGKINESKEVIPE